MHADRGHVHHLLIDMGFSQKQAVAISYLLSAILGLAAVVLTDRGEVQAMIFIGAILVVGAIGAVVIFGTHHKKHEAPQQTDLPEEGTAAAPEEKAPAAPEEKAPAAPEESAAEQPHEEEPHEED